MSSSPPPPHSTLRIGVVGCTHGELDLLYRRVLEANATAPDKRPIDLLICCGDFQAVRNEADLRTMACPDKYKSMQDFWRYYTGERTPPVPTLFIGGNHESAAHCGELPLGGWVAPGIYYLGTSGCVNFGGVRIAGVSGIFKSHDCWKGYFERPPYSPGDLKSINHQRAFDFWRCAHLCSGGGGGGGGAGGGAGGAAAAATAAAPVDIFLTHDWPQGIVEHGDKAALLRKKPFFREDVEKGELGSPPSMQLLHALQPRHWFSGHLHCRFAATVHHPTTPPTTTHFLALDKPVQGRNYFEVMDIPVRSSPTLDGGFTHPIPKAFHYDTLWMAAVVATHGATPLGSAPARRDSLPPPSPPSPALIQSVAVALATMSSAFAGEGGGGGGGGGSSAVDLVAAAKANPLHPIAIPLNFQPTAPGYREEGRGRGSGSGSGSGGDSGGSSRRGNPQMDTLLWALGLPHITTFPCEEGGGGVVGRGVQDYLSQVSAVFAALPPDVAVGAAGTGSGCAGGLMGAGGGAEVKDANALDID